MQNHIFNQLSFNRIQIWRTQKLKINFLSNFEVHIYKKKPYPIFSWTNGGTKSNLYLICNILHNFFFFFLLVYIGTEHTQN